MKPPIVLVATEGWSRLTDKALSFALTISPDVYAVHLKAVEGRDAAREKEKELRARWAAEGEEPARAAGLRPPRLVMVESSYRRFEEPLLGLVEQLQKEEPQRVVAVLLPALVKPHWWAYLLHTNRGRRMRKALLKSAGPRLVIMTIPWTLNTNSATPRIEAELEPEVELAERAAVAIAARLRGARP